MIVTFTPNPSVDRSITVAQLTPGAVHRATASRLDAGGKGVNVTRALTAQGSASLAVLPVGGTEGQLLTGLLNASHVPFHGVAIAQALRMNITVVEPSGATTKLNEPGPQLSKSECDNLSEAALDLANTHEATWLTLCGSLPPGVSDDYYATIVSKAHEAGLKVAVDTSGKALALAVEARPQLIKPNLEELIELAGRELTTLGDVIDVAHELVRDGVESVAVSLGKDGAVLVGESGAVFAQATVQHPVSTVGAGDCMLAGLLDALSHGNTALEAVATAVRWGTAAVTLPGSSVPTKKDVSGIVANASAHPPLSLKLHK